VRPLTKCQPHLWRELDGTPSIVVIDTESGSYYRASEADARIRHYQDEALCAEEAAMSHAQRVAELERDLKTLAEASRNRIAELQTERDAARADAERWRAACDEGRVGLNREGEVVILHNKGDADAAIDAARGAE
jgi:hypothetical protein